MQEGRADIIILLSYIAASRVKHSIWRRKLGYA